ncbi:BQ5605_C041g11974 [Microbotryum silenes-dioicae]|uniref:BQ5605_C041g11974 protein n=1 Tax=Microbotryum silenes-dioicae TaxID=796604 RepID=A0A2X0PQD2_9BASI|nr:BQ5605_C041g11974 [Microbotryum silenes-dioicae]
MKFIKLLGAMIALFTCACQVHAGGCQSAENHGWLPPGNCASRFVECLVELQKSIGLDGQDETKLKNGRADCIKAFDKFDTTVYYDNCVSILCRGCDEPHGWYELIWRIWGRHLCHKRQKKYCHAVWMDDS